MVRKGDPDDAGLYSNMLRIPAHTRIAAHVHQDDRVATVVSGTWHLGYDDRFYSADLNALPPGSCYTEPLQLLALRRNRRVNPSLCR
jgi:hypothetical protein